MKRWLVMATALLLLMCLSIGVMAQKKPPLEQDGSYSITVKVIAINLPGDGLIYDGRFEFDNDLVLTIPKIRNPPFTTMGVVMVKASEPYINMVFTGRSNNPSTTFNSGGALPWGREAMCVTQVMYFGSADGLGTIGIELTITPGGSLVSRTAAAGHIDACESDVITLEAAPNYGWYEWEYKDQSTSVFKPFYNPRPETSIATFTIEDIYGPGYQSKLNTQIYFQMHIGACPPTEYDSYTFFPAALTVLSEAESGFSKTDAVCYEGKGSASVKKLNRNIASGETLVIKIFNQADNVEGGIPVAQATNVTALPVNFTDLNPGSYKFFVESVGFQCGDTQNPLTMSFVIDRPSQVAFTPSALTPPSCHTNAVTGTKNNGQVTIDPAGGSGSGYKYSINGGAFQSAGGADPFIITGLSATGYSIKVRDGNDCEVASAQSVNIGEPTDITLGTPVVVDATCFGGNTGRITMNSSGAATLNYSLNGGTYQASPVFNGLTENSSYVITVKDGNNCTKNTAAIPVDAPNEMVATVTPTGATCNETANGSITMTGATGGTGAFSYSLNGTVFQSETSFTGLLGNNYTVTIKDAAGCIITRNTTVPKPLAVGVSSVPTLVTCFGGNNGSVQITAINAIGTPMYSLNGSAFQVSDTFTNLSANTYSITIKDGNGCTGTSNTTISSNPIITGAIAITTPISCNGGNNGALNLTPGGGVGPYTFTWSNSATTEDITNLTANTYTVVIKDNKDCTQTFNRTLSQPLPITVNPTLSDYNGSNVSCFGGNNGSITTSASGGNGGYTYLWSNGATTPGLSALAAGSYNVTVTDNKSCTGNQLITITQPAQLATTFSDVQNIACFGASTGNLTVTTTGGTANYQYSINGGTNWQSSPTFPGLNATSYTLMTRDANGCIDTDGITLTSPSNLVLTVNNVTNTTCNQSNGSALVSAVGGISAYTYNWFNSSNAQIGTGSNISNLAAGIYRVVVTDINNCSKQQNVTISSSNGPAIAVQTITPASCSNTSDGTATINVTQGQAPYTILWPNNQTTATATNLAGGDYTVEVRDNTNCLALQNVTVPAPQPLTLQTTTQQDPNCNGNSDGQIIITALGGNGGYTYNWNTGQTTSTLNNLSAGTYTATTKDSKNCQATQQYTLINPPVFTINLGSDEKICEGQTITKIVSEANATYNWTGPNSFTSTQQEVSISQPGTYTVSVTSSKGCQANDSFVLSFDTDLLKADFLMVSEAYAGDTIIVIDISWPVPTASNWQFDAHAIVIDESPDFSLIRFDEPGTYNNTLQAQLAQCASTRSQSITIIDNPDEEGRENGKKGERLIRTLHVYPNPALEKLTVEIELNRINETQLELYHLHSNRRELVKTFEGNSLYETEIRLDHLQTGLYVVVVKAGSELKSVKIIKL